MGRDMGPVLAEIEKYKHLSYALWKILDDIDTTSDICRSDNERYREKVESLHVLRFVLCDKETVELLYEQYYPKQEDAVDRDMIGLIADYHPNTV